MGEVSISVDFGLEENCDYGRKVLFIRVGQGSVVSLFSHFGVLMPLFPSAVAVSVSFGWTLI